MKQYFVRPALLAAFALLAVPASLFAQKEKDKEKTKDDANNMQQIIITRHGDKNEKTVIEIKGDKIMVNGKDASKSDDVTVHLNNLNGTRNRVYYRGNVNPDMNFEFNDDDFDHDSNISLFSEDSNRAMLGVTTDEDDKGARITGITHESGADKAGLKVGDVITKIGDAKIEDADDVSEAVHQHKPGEKIPITILRNGKEQKITAELGKWKGVRINNLNAAIAPMTPMPPMGPQYFKSFSYNVGSGPKLGLSVQDTDDGKGVKVLDVADESSAAKAGIKKDDIITKINDDEVNSTDEVVEAMSDARDEPKVNIQVVRGGKPQTIAVTIPRKLKKADL